MRKKKQNTTDILIYISSVLLAIGVFLPLTTLPLYGEVSYHRVSELESYLVIAFAISAPVFLFITQSKFLRLSVAGVWITLLFPAIKSLFKSSDGGMLSKIGDSASSAMSDFAADLFLNIADFHWGGMIFLLGLLIFTISCLLRSFNKS